MTEARKSGTGEPSADEESEAEVDQTVVFPNVSQMNSCVRRSLLRSAIRLLKLPSAMRARLSLPSLAARSLTVCMAAVTRMPASSPLLRSSIMGPLMTLAVSSTKSETDFTSVPDSPRLYRLPA